MEKLLLRHLKGSKAGETENFALSAYPEILIGRDPASALRFDPAQDDLVGRQHARITRDGPNSTTFSLTDLDSRNGTFLNKQRVSGKVAIRPGDIVQLGAGGPEFEFDLEPRPAPEMKATRLGMSSAPSADATRVSVAAPVAMGTSPVPVSGNVGGPVAGAIGKATVERMITATHKKSRTVNYVMGGAFALLASAAVVWANSRPTVDAGQITADARTAAAKEAARLDSIRGAEEKKRDPGTISPAEIGTKFGPAVVQIYFSWKLEYSGQPVFHHYIPNSYKDKANNVQQIIPGGPPSIPTYIVVGEGRIEPSLTLAQGQGRPIGVTGSGTGFVVSSDGFILTNRHVGANWMAPYSFQRSDVGVLVGPRGIVMRDDGTPAVTAPPDQWIPSESKQAGPKGIIGEFAGRHEYIKVGFQGNVNYIDAGPVTTSPRADVALMSVKVPRPLVALTLNDNYTSIRQGEQVTVMGYPGVSDVTYAVVKSKDTFNQESQSKIVPEVTLTTGTIAKVTKAGDTDSNAAQNYIAPSGDRFQLGINTTGSGNSGGPLFDHQGRVIGIFFAGRQADVSVSFAVPIKYGMELMNVGPTTR
jgi:serine protease Do